MDMSGDTKSQDDKSMPGMDMEKDSLKNGKTETRKMKM
jgi:hypothetical protein